MTSIVWIITAKCQLSCPHCYAKMYVDEEELSRDLKLKLADEMGLANISHVAISGGEPLILKEFVDIVRILRDYNIEISIVTNGLVHDEDVIRALSRYEIFTYVSIDGDRIGHEIVRPNTWNRVMKFIQYLKNYGVKFGTSMAVSKLNVDRVSHYIDTVVKLDPDTICLIPVMPSGNALKNKIYLNTEDVKYMIDLIDEKVNEYSINVRIWCLPCVRAYTSNSRIIGGLCKQWDVIDITPSGRLVICDILNIELSRWTPGNLENCIEDFKSSRMYIEARSVPEECRSCRFVNSCMGGCFARAYIKYGSFLKKDPLCPLVY